MQACICSAPTPSGYLHLGNAVNFVLTWLLVVCSLRLRLVGHTDNQGADEANRTLSEARARAVVAALGSQQGIDASRLEAQGQGASQPVAPNGSEDGRARNRRVEVIALAGYMRLLSDAFVARWRGRILNIHPSLLPKYQGLHTHQRAIDAGDDEQRAVLVVLDHLPRVRRHQHRQQHGQRGAHPRRAGSGAAPGGGGGPVPPAARLAGRWQVRQSLGLPEDAYVLIDTPPGSTSYLKQAFRSADFAFLIILADAASYLTLPAMEGWILDAIQTNPKLRFTYLMNQADNSLSLHRDLQDVLRLRLGDRLSPVSIHRDEAVSEAIAYQQVVIDYDPHGQASHDLLRIGSWLAKQLAQ